MAGPNGKWVNPRVSEYRGGWVPGTTIQSTFQSLTSFLGGWVNDSGRYPIISTEASGYGAVRGNATVQSFYKVTGDECHWVGLYVWGSTTTTAAVALHLFSPFNINTNEFGSSALGIGAPVFGARAYDSSAAARYAAYAECGGSAPPTTDAVLIGVDGTPNVGWDSTHPFTWASGDMLGWDLTFRIQA